MRIIIRRPHAYEFRTKDKDVPIPGVVFLDAEGKLVGTAKLETATQLVKKMDELTK